jgi:hypothetical protein
MVYLAYSMMGRKGRLYSGIRINESGLLFNLWDEVWTEAAILKQNLESRITASPYKKFYGKIYFSKVNS